MKSNKLIDRLIGPILGLGAFLLFLSTLAGGAYPGQSALLVAERTGLFPSLAPNSPLWHFIGTILARIGASGAVAWRLNLFSAVCGALSIWLVYGLMNQLVLLFIDDAIIADRRAAWAARIAGTTTALFLMFSIPFWIVSNRAHTGGLDLLMLLIAARLILQYLLAGRMRDAIIFSFFYGLGIVESATFITAAPVFGIVLLVGIWRHESLRFTSVITLVGAALLGLAAYLPTAWAFYGSEGYVLREYGSFFDIIWFMWRDQFALISRSLPREGWLIILFMTVVPWLAALSVAKRALNDERDWSFYLLHMVMTGLAIAILLNAEFSPWGMMGYGRILVTPYLLTATVFGYVAAYWFLLFANRGVEEGRATPFVRNVPGTLLAVALVGLALWAPFRNVSMADARPSRTVNAMAEEVVRSLDGCTWLVTDGSIDQHLLVAAHRLDVPLQLLNINGGRSSVYMSYLEGKFDDPRMKNLLRFGIRHILYDWMKNDPDICSNLAVMNEPDLWVAAGYVAVPNKLIFLGAPQQEADEAETLLASHRAYWDRFLGISADPFEDGSPLARWWRNMVRHNGMIANNLGVYLEDVGDVDGAAAAYNASREIDADNISALLNLYGMVQNGHIEDPDGSFAAAVDLIEEEQKGRFRIWSLSRYYGYVRLPEAFARLGWTWANSGRAGLGLAEMKKAMALLPDSKHDAVRRLMADVYLSQQKPGESREIYEDILTRTPNDPAALLGMYRVSMRSGDLDAALSYLERAAKTEADSTKIGIEKSAVLLLQGKGDQARELLEELLRLNPDSVRGWRLLAEVLLELKQKSAMERCLRRLEDKEGYDGYNLSIMRGRLAMDDGDVEAAYGFFEKALLRRPKNVQLLEWFVEMDMKFRMLGKARKHVMALLRLKPTSALGHYVLGSMQVADGDLALAESSLRQSLSLRGSDAAHNDLAWVLMLVNRLGEAEEHVRQALKMNPDSGAAWDTLGSVLLRQMRYKEATEALERALALKELPGTYLRMAECLVLLGNRKRASDIVTMLLPRREELPPDAREKLLAIQTLLKE